MIYAYVTRGKDPLLDTHLMFLIETFWITLALWILGFVLLFALGLGFIVMAFVTVWNAARLISGFLIALNGEPIKGTKYLGMIAI